jgi:ribosomal protein S18 acetylase RimI-like enzyme
VVAGLLAAFRDWWGYTAPSDDSMHGSVERLIRDPSSTEFLLGAAAVSGSPTVGVVQLRFRHSVWTGGDDAWLEDLYVRDAARGSGLGRALTEYAIERASARGCGRIQLDVNTGNEPAHALYRSLGFESYADPPGGETLMMGRKLQAVRDGAHHDPSVQS